MMLKFGLLLACVFNISWAFLCVRMLDYNWPRGEDCRSYYQCYNGVATEHKCLALFRKFNPETLKCDWAWKVNCSARPHLPIPGTVQLKSEDPPTLTYACNTTIKDYNWPRGEDCRSYYHCHNGTATEDKCVTLFRKFNPETLECDWAWKVNCSAVPHLPSKDPPTKPSEPAHEDVPNQSESVSKRPDKEEVNPKDPPTKPSEPAHEDVPHQSESVSKRPDKEEVNPKVPPTKPSKPVHHEDVPHQSDRLDRDDSEEVNTKDTPAEPSESAHEDIPHQSESVSERKDSDDSEEVNTKDTPAEPSVPAHEDVPHYEPDFDPEDPVNKDVPTLYPA